MLEVAVYNAVVVDLLKTVCDLGEELAAAVFRKSINTEGAQVAEEVAAACKLGYNVGFTVVVELFDEVNDGGVALAHVHCLALADLVFKAQSLVFLSLHGFDGNADARDFVEALPDGIAAALANGFFNGVLVEWAGEALDAKNSLNELLAGLASFSEDSAALVLWQDELDWVPEELGGCLCWELHGASLGAVFGSVIVARICLAGLLGSLLDVSGLCGQC